MFKFVILTGDFIISSFRSKKAVIFLILYLVVFLLITYSLIQVQARIYSELENRGVDERGRNMVMELAKGVLKGQANNKIVDYLLSVPFLNIALFVVSLFGTPILIVIWKYDLIAQEAYDKTLRFLVFRVSRFKILMAKYASSVIEIMGVTFAAFLAGIIWAVIVLPQFSLQKSFSAGILFFLASQFFFSVIVSFTLLISVMVKKPFTALLLSFLGLVAFAVIPVWIRYISPFDIAFLGGLFAGSSLEFFFSAGIYLLFAAFFLGGAYLLFRRRNL